MKFSALGLAETYVGNDETASLFRIDGYNGFYNDKIDNKAKGTGVALYIDNTLNAVVNEKLNLLSPNMESIFVTISDNAKKINVGTIYHSPSGDEEKFLEDFTSLLEQLPQNTTSIILGDFNFDLFKRLEPAVGKFENIFLSQGLFPLISLSTHRRANCNSSSIDNILTNNVEDCHVSGVINDIGLNHSPIFSIFNLKLSSPDNKAALQIQEYSFSAKNIEALKQELNAELIDVYKELDFESFFQLFTNGIDQCCKLKKPKYSKRNPINNPWITDGIIDAIEHKNALYIDWIKTKRNENDPGCQTLYEKFSKYRYCLKKVIKDQKSWYFKNKISQSSGDIKKTWEIINKLRGKSKKSIKPCFLVNGELVLQRRIIANKFNEYFASLATNLNDGTSDLLQNITKTFKDYMPPSTPNSIYLQHCTEDEVGQIIKELENSKSRNFPIRVIKKLSHILTPVLTAHFNRAMMEGTFPSILKLGKITPVYKKDDEQLLENYRPISTLPIFGKIFEKIIYTRLYGFFTSNNILNKSQFGFRKSHSTSHALNYSINCIEKSIKKGNSVLGIFIDLSKAFDTIDHKILLAKLENYGIRGVALKLIESYLSDRKQLVNILGEISDELLVLFGVPQGSCLGPLLFLIYINGLPNISNNAEFVLFADDTNIFVEAKNRMLAYENANKILKAVHLYMLVNKLHINTSKCCFIDFKPDKNVIPDSNLCLKINNVVIKQVNEARFLGVTLDENLNWKSHIHKLSKKLSCSAGILNLIKDSIPEDLYKSLYFTLFESHLSYGITVWGGVSNNKLEPLFKLQKKCMRILFGDKEAYLNKFKTCARSRPLDNQILGQEFYSREHTKPLFNQHGIMNVRNLHIYHCSNEILKILKFRTPYYTVSLNFLSSQKGTEKRLDC